MSEDTNLTGNNFMSSDSVQDSMSEVFDKMQEEDSSPEPKEEPKTEEESADYSTPDEGTQEEAQEDVSEPEEDHTETAEVKEDKTEESPEQPSGKIPIGLSDEIKEKWDEIPDYIKTDLDKREKDFSKNIAKSAEFVKHSQAIRNIEAPYQAMMQSLGANSMMAYQDHLKHAYTLNHGSQEQKVQLVQNILRTFGIEIPSNQGFKEDWEDDFQNSSPDPKVEHLTNQVNVLTNVINGQEQKSRDSQQHKADMVIDSFRNDPKHKYFDEVNPLMQGILQSGQARNLDEAYEMATMAHPKVRTSVLANKNGKESKVRRQEAKAKTAKSKNAESTNLRSKGGKVSLSESKETVKRGKMPDFSKTMASVYDSFQEE